MINSLHKTFVALIALSSACIAIELVPVSRQAAYWNRCFESTVNWIDQSKDLYGWGEKAKQSLAVGVCNGAVYETKLKTN